MRLKVFQHEELRRCIAVVVGTRPGIIKFSPIIRELEKRGTEYFIIHTGQHYSYNMDRQFFEDLELPDPKYTNDNVRKWTTHGTQTAEMIKGVEAALIMERPKVVIVGGDANTNLAGALAARKLGLTLAHLEAGLRSNDWRMPEEHNRVMIDHISDILFPPTEMARQNLIKDNVKGRIIVTGNTIVDAVYQNLEIACGKSKVLEHLGLINGDYFLLTIHREENVDSEKNLTNILWAVDQIGRQYGAKILFPAHPRTMKRLKFFQLEQICYEIKNLTIIEPVGYMDFLVLLSNARIVLTDSGGVQEESCILKIPCITLRDNTERPETVDVGANVVATTVPETVLDAIELSIQKKNLSWTNPFGDGKAAERIVNELLTEVNS